MSYLVYLSGPIKGRTYNESNRWRLEAEVELDPYLNSEVIRVLNPLRWKEFLGRDEVILAAYPNHPLGTARGITCRDRFDVARCDAMLVNVLGAKFVSVGTVMEVAWASALEKPIVLVIEREGNPHDHSIFIECCDFRTETLKKGCKLIKEILL